MPLVQVPCDDLGDGGDCDGDHDGDGGDHEHDYGGVNVINDNLEKMLYIVNS